MNREEAREKAKRLVSQMTPEERISQLSFRSPAILRLGIPAYNWWSEALHGVARAGTATVFPQAIGMAASFDTGLLRAVGDAVSTEGRAKYNACVAHEDRDIYKGLTFWSPNVNIFRDPRWGRGQETYGEDSFLTARLGVAFVRGIQGEGDTLKAAACAKHFAVHSGPEAVRHTFDARVSKKDLAETYLPAFKALVTEAKAEAVMGAYNRLNGEPCSGNRWLIQEVLRGKWGFEGHFVSDAWALPDFHKHHKVTRSATETAAKALLAGCDLACCETYEAFLPQAYAEGMVCGQDITTAAEHLFTTRFWLGMFDGSEYDHIPYEAVECPKHLALAERAAAEGIVLLKNDGLLPLSRSRIKTVGVIGPNADSRSALIGNYHGTSSEYITVLDGIRRVAGEEVRILYSQGSDLAKNRVEELAQPGDRLAEAKIVAEHSDVVILCLGFDETLEGEEGDTGNSYASGDKTDLSLPKAQQKLMEAIRETGKPTVLCLMTGSAVDLRFAEEHFSAVLQLWYPGARGGKVAAQILFGDISPSGKLPITFYSDLSFLPGFEDYSMRGRTYRYMEGEALYPFGYGLTYGRAEVTHAGISHNDGKGVELTVLAENRSGRETEDVLEVYLEHRNSVFAPPHPVLCAFKRIRLAAHEAREERLFVRADAFPVVNEEGEHIVDGSKYVLHVGFSQPDRRSISLTGSVPYAVPVSGNGMKA